MSPEADFAWLKEKAFNDYSQNGEDGVLDAIFKIVRPTNEWCFECGASDGLFFSNVRRLIEQGWKGILVEADEAVFRRLMRNSAVFGERVKLVHHRAERLDDILHKCGAPLDIDLVVVDVDGQDYYLFNSLLRYRPRVVIVEFDPNVDENFIPTLGGPGQAGSAAIANLVRGRLYDLVYSNFCNMVFVHQFLSPLLRRE